MAENSNKKTTIIFPYTGDYRVDLLLAPRGGESHSQIIDIKIIILIQFFKIPSKHS